ncbi:MAG: hypothetical protein ABR582_16940, partial [Gemmatimonadaceae bacterium]
MIIPNTYTRITAALLDSCSVQTRTHDARNGAALGDQPPVHELDGADVNAARDEGKAILLVSAELNEVLALSDRIAVMYRGKFAVVM